MIYYKVLKLCSGDLVSLNPTARVIYKVGEWVKPTLEGSKLFVFNTYEDAYEFSRYSFAKEAIYKCEVENPTKGLVCCHNDEYNEFWKTVNDRGVDTLQKNPWGRIWFPMGTPAGTVFVDRVKIIEEVK